MTAGDGAHRLEQRGGGWEGAQPGVPPAGRPPPPHECHLWAVAPDGDLASWAGLLSPEDAAYVARHRRPEDREARSISRGLLRLLVGHYLAVGPHEVPLRRRCLACGTEGHGSPEVLGGSGLAVSTSHGGDWVLAAVVSRGTVGVDLERVSPLQDPDQLAATVLAPSELSGYRAAPEPDRAARVLRAWVRKEAVVKAVGLGLTLDPADIDVSGPWAGVQDGPGPAGQLVHLRDVEAATDHLAALASSVPVTRVRTFLVRAPAADEREPR